MRANLDRCGVSLTQFYQADGRGIGRKVGERLRAIRRQKRMSLQEVEATSKQEFKASVLGAYERGERAISVPRLQRLARFYSVPVDQLLPGDEGPDFGHPEVEDETIIDLTDSAQATQLLGGITIDITKLDTISGPEAGMLNRYLTMIQVQRQDFNGRVLTIRRDDLQALAAIPERPAERLPNEVTMIRIDELNPDINRSYTAALRGNMNRAASSAAASPSS